MKNRMIRCKVLVVIILLIVSIKSFSQVKELEDGYHKFYHPNGNVSSEGYIKDGKPDGYWKNYYMTGILKSEGKRVNNKLDSIWIFYDHIGDTLKKISYLYGKKNGYYFEYEYDEKTNRNVIVSKKLYINDKLEGRAFEYYKDGNYEKVISYEEGRKSGPEYLFNKDGRIITINYYLKGKLTAIDKINRRNVRDRKTGLWREYYPDFKVKKEMNYKDGLLEGLYKEFDEKGRMTLSLLYEKDIIVSEEDDINNDVEIKSEYDEEGNLLFNGAYRNGKPVGIHRNFNKMGEVISSKEYDDNGHVIGEGIINLEGRKEGNWIEYYIDGKVKARGNYRDGNRNGRWEFLYRKGNIEQKGSFRNGYYNGLWIWYYENGQIRKEENYYNGKEDGLSVEYNEIGEEIAKGEYIDGEKDGFWFYEIGDIRREGSYITGLRDGKWIYYYKNGNKAFEGNYIQGNKDGKHFEFYDNGNIKEERFYNAGFREKTWKKYDENGNLILSITYRDNQEIKVNGIKIDLPDSGIKRIK